MVNRTLEEALALAEKQRLELPQIVQVVPSDHDRIIMADEIARLREEAEIFRKGYEAAMRIVKTTYAEKFPDSYFIHGELGEKDENGLPEKILVVPAYGVDWFQVYDRTDKTHGPEY